MLTSTVFSSIKGSRRPASRVGFICGLPQTSGFANLAAQRPQSYVAIAEQGTEVVARLLAEAGSAGDCICLRGGVGAGKSAFSRAYIRTVEEDDSTPVPSPTFLLQNVYEYNKGPSIYHYDLYRLHGGVQLQRLDLASSLKDSINLIEWPERLGDMTPENRLDLELKILDLDDGVLSSAHKLLQASQNALPTDLAEENDIGEEDYTDRRWRLICLSPFGARWKALLETLEPQLCNAKGLHVLSTELRQCIGLDSDAHYSKGKFSTEGDH